MNGRGIIEEGVLLTAEDQLDGDTAAEFASFIDDMNSTDHADAWISVMRIPVDARGAPQPNSKHMGQLFHEPLGTSSVNDVIERIRRDYIRPGENSITVRIIGKQQGKQGLKFNRIYTIERANNKPAGEPGARDGIAELGRMLLDMQRATDERFERMMQMRPATAVVDPIDQMVKVMGVMAPIMAAVAGRPVTPGGGASDLLSTVKTLKEASALFGGGNAEPASDVMGTVKAVAEAIGPGLKFLANKSEVEKLGAVERVRSLPPPAPRAAQSPTIPRQPAPPKPAPSPRDPGQGTIPNNKAGAPKAPEVEDVNLKEMRDNLLAVAAMADEGQSPQAVAEMMVDNVEEDQLEALYQRAADVNFIGQCRTICPTAIAGREQWFEDLRKAIVAQYEESPDGEDDPGETNPHVDDANMQVNGSNLAASPVDLDDIPDAS